MTARTCLLLLASPFIALFLFLAIPVHAAPPPDAAPSSVIDAGPDNGIGTSPSSPAVTAPTTPTTATADAIVEPGISDAWSAFSAGRYAMGIASLLFAGLVLLRKAMPALFSSDAAGAATALASSFLAGLITAGSTGAPFGWSMVKASFVVAVLAMGGYSVLWKKLVKPALYWLAAKAGWDGAARLLEGA